MGCDRHPDINGLRCFAVVAFSLPSLSAADVVGIGGGNPEPGAPMTLLGPGTGLGVAA